MIVAANLKTNLTRKQTNIYIKELEKFLSSENITQDIFVFPATSSLDTFDTQTIVGAQNAYPVQNGAFTGEIGLDHLDEFGIKTILIGHSERRHILGESQEAIAEKFNYFKELGFTIVYCVGEPLEKREAGSNVMMEYINAQYEGIDTKYEKLIIAYEPVWAIGTGLTPTNEDILAIHRELKKKSQAPLLYGGSVKVNNAKEIMALQNVDGVLVGSAALNVEDFCQMAVFAEDLEK
ncbi:triose-phosphate isomerase [Sulfurimonas sp. C5]|uniref:triose-phosphate isomerase n=1 Tax=Sulfurimonas sp. C5 TaxID=3036947 RepID=UPI0024565373|nr:triose-phosphate isomerase [Sulfurimonas sp. C5]MDH4945212.1 triose-phosphate isomerase [Sulfurimonas sp. C5]